MKKALILLAAGVILLLIALLWLQMTPPRVVEEAEIDYPEIDYTDERYTWNARVGARGGDTLVRGEKIDEIRDDPEKLVLAFNRSGRDPETFRTTENDKTLGPPKLKLLDLEGNLATVEVINARYLTQRMGTTGADAFMAAATFTLTEHDAVDAVRFVFPEGDHAMPGIYSRDTFTARWRIGPEDKKNDGPPPPKPSSKKPIRV